MAGWISVASAFHNNANINFMTDNVALTCILIIRIIYLIVFVTGSVFSLIFLLLAYNDKTYGLAIPVCYYDINYFKIYLVNFSSLKDCFGRLYMDFRRMYYISF